jgi:hypothetical protein
LVFLINLLCIDIMVLSIGLTYEEKGQINYIIKMVSRGCSHIPLHHNCSVCGIYISQEEGMQAVRSDTISCLEITNLRRY